MANLTVYLLKVANLRTVDRHLRYPGKLRSISPWDEERDNGRITFIVIAFMVGPGHTRLPPFSVRCYVQLNGTLDVAKQYPVTDLTAWSLWSLW